jgi:alkanesulfonate monooxygenase SsuD/methylene tetrahydromethanopterin reductase-like flavin-dependent oxidoreductase (luciferase family)
MSGAKFGIVLLPESFDGFGDLCREAESQGFEWVGVADSQSVFHELYVALTLAALNTSRVRVGRS